MRIQPGYECADLDEFIALLRSWLAESSDERISADGAFKLGYLKVPISGLPCSLSGDTTRAGVTEFLARYDADPVVGVIANAVGNHNLVVAGGAQTPIKGFYLYTSAALAGPLILSDRTVEDAADVAWDEELRGLLAEGAVPALPGFLGEEWEAPMAALRAILESFESTFVLEVTRSDGGSAYVQGRREDGGLELEAVSNEHLEQDERLLPQQVAQLLELGWSPPDDNSPNFHRWVAEDTDLTVLAWALLSVLHDVYGVGVADEWGVIPETLGPLAQAAMDRAAEVESREDAEAATATATATVAEEPVVALPQVAHLVLEMVGVLHARGHQRLRICPGASGAGVYRCEIAPAEALTGRRRMLPSDETSGQGRVVRWSSAEGPTPYGLTIHRSSTPESLADQFVTLHPRLAEAGRGADWSYAGWYVELLETCRRHNAVPLAYSDFGSSEDGYLSFSEDTAGRMPVAPLPDEADPQPSVPAWAGLTVQELLSSHVAVLHQLRQRGIVSSGNSVVGDYSEILVTAALDGDLAPKVQKGFDLTAPEWGRVQVKARLVSDPSTPGQLQSGVFHGADFDHAAFVQLSKEDYGVKRVVLLPRAALEELWSWKAHVNGWIVQMNDKLVSHPAAVDVTEAAHAAGLTLMAAPPRGTS